MTSFSPWIAVRLSKREFLFSLTDLLERVNSSSCFWMASNLAETSLEFKPVSSCFNSAILALSLSMDFCWTSKEPKSFLTFLKEEISLTKRRSSTRDNSPEEMRSSDLAILASISATVLKECLEVMEEISAIFLFNWPSISLTLALMTSLLPFKSPWVFFNSPNSAINSFLWAWTFGSVTFLLIKALTSVNCWSFCFNWAFN
ncbi:hypothetical protein WICPIJ_006897 [Wickerhamomyces pijperi]|uniref:Uncharacterized protein n=1 Tax=Wickerhamomyces pijperi TaxID=599730 RepID=A0A9P8Q3K8_WICPI|nr:hypothetical protein WICPIJ_006897 [Wickerhamomyces pijperi]